MTTLKIKFPDDIYRRIDGEAAARGLSVIDYLGKAVGVLTVIDRHRALGYRVELTDDKTVKELKVD